MTRINGTLLEDLCTFTIVKVKVKQSRFRPGQALKVPRFHDNGTGWWQVVSLTQRPPLPPGNSPGTHFCWRLSIYDSIAMNYFRMPNISHKSRGKKSKHVTFYSDDRGTYESKMLQKNATVWNRPQMTTMWYRRFACWITKATDTNSVSNIHCFSTATIVTRTRPNIT